MTKFKWPLMQGNLRPEDFDSVRKLLGTEANGDVRLTMGEQVEAFEEEFARWQGAKYAVMVNSGASANLVTMAAMRERELQGASSWWSGGDKNPDVIVPAITWSSDIASVIHAGFEPLFVDVDRQTLGASAEGVQLALDGKPAAVFLTHCFGFNALGSEAYAAMLDSRITLIEDCCESIGARTRWAGRKHKVGNFGLAANFSFYYSHHMTTVEGGMVTTDDEEFANCCRMLRNHGMTRGVEHVGKPYDCEELDPDFTFAMPGFNMRSQEINAAIGRSQLKRLDANIEERRRLAAAWYGVLDGDKYQTDFDLETSSPYGLVLLPRKSDGKLKERVENALQSQSVEYRGGVAGGGNQLRQPYLRRIYGDLYKQFPNAEHLHNYGFAVGLWPDLPQEWIETLAVGLNKL